MRHAKTAGFSLIEIAIILVIFGGIAAMTSTIGLKWMEKTEVSTSEANIDLVQRALDAYRKASGRLPCPAVLTLTENDANYGLESWQPGENLGECDGGGTIDVALTGSTAVGAIPANTLGIGENLMRDQWGNLLVYYVDPAVTADGAFDERSSNYIAMDDATVGTITVNDGAGTARTTKAIYAILSHGPNAHGAYNKSGTRMVDSDANADELENCDCDASAAAGAANEILVARLIDEQFDDVVFYKERAHMFNKIVLNNCTPAPATCTPVAGDMVPAMSSYSSGGITISESSTYGSSPAYAGWMAFNGGVYHLDDAWISLGSWTKSTNLPQWLAIEFPEMKKVTSYSIQNRNWSGYHPVKDWTLEGSNDGTSWTVVDTNVNVADWGQNNTQTFTVDTPGAYSRYRFNVTDNHHLWGVHYVAIGEVDLFGEDNCTGGGGGMC